jgi:hypothetical protein
VIQLASLEHFRCRHAGISPGLNCGEVAVVRVESCNGPGLRATIMTSDINSNEQLGNIFNPKRLVPYVEIRIITKCTTATAFASASALRYGDRTEEEVSPFGPRLATLAASLVTDAIGCDCRAAIGEFARFSDHIS